MSSFPLRPHQKTALDVILPAIEAGPCKLVYKAPTGSGKTRTAIEMIRFAREEFHWSVGFTTPRISLIEQGCRDFEREGLRHIGVIQGANKRTNPAAPIQIISVATWARRDDAAVCYGVNRKHAQRFVEAGASPRRSYVDDIADNLGCVAAIAEAPTMKSWVFASVPMPVKSGPGGANTLNSHR